MNGLYLIQATGTTRFKIGITTDLKQRLENLQSSSPLKLRVATFQTHPQASLTEKYLHHKFDKYRIHGEWFDFPPFVAIEVLKCLEAICSLPSANKLGVDNARLNKAAKMPASFENSKTPYNLGKQYDTKASRKAAKKLRIIYAQTNEIPTANALSKQAKVSWSTANNVIQDFQA